MLLEIFGVLTGIIYVFLEARQNKLLWPLGFITSAVYVWVFFDTKFYADMGLQIYYVLISVYGWFAWTKKANTKMMHDSSQQKTPSKTRVQELIVSSISTKLALFLFILFIGIWTGIYFILNTYTDSSVPLGDSFTTALAIIATWMLTRKFIEQWYLWMIANVVSMALYIHKGLYPTVILYAVYAAMSVYGYYEWKRSMNKQDE